MSKYTGSEVSKRYDKISYQTLIDTTPKKGVVRRCRVIQNTDNDMLPPDLQHQESYLQNAVCYQSNTTPNLNLSEFASSEKGLIVGEQVSIFFSESLKNQDLTDHKMNKIYESINEGKGVCRYCLVQPECISALTNMLNFGNKRIY